MPGIADLLALGAEVALARDDGTREDLVSQFAVHVLRFFKHGNVVVPVDVDKLLSG